MKTESRRTFIAKSAATLGMLGVTPAVAFAGDTLSIATATDLVGLRLHLAGVSGNASGVVRVTSLEEIPSVGVEQFYLRLCGRRGVSLPEDIYRASNWAGLPGFDMHIVPSGEDGRGRSLYIASFALLR